MNENRGRPRCDFSTRCSLLAAPAPGRLPRRHGAASAAREYDALGDQFEKKEHDLFGADGFEKVVDDIAGLEKKIGLYDLAGFTPPA
ncbi:MAG TPA: hypothetical protein VER78_05185 [Thermoanaerobaculia bacterium]|nr:hypothetical protein [Thermoanaerobaculia bacterium]